MNITQISRRLKLLGNPYRLRIVVALKNGELTVGNINKQIKISQPALSQHLIAMRQEGVLGKRREARNVYYYIADATVLTTIGSVPQAA